MYQKRVIQRMSPATKKIALTCNELERQLKGLKHLLGTVEALERNDAAVSKSRNGREDAKVRLPKRPLLCAEHGVELVQTITDRLVCLECPEEGREATCDLCGQPSPGGNVHMACANYEQALADRASD